MSNKEVQVIIINGSGGCGKGTFIEKCKECALKYPYDNTSLKIEELSSIDWVKVVARFCGWDDKQKTEKDRLFLFELKQALEKYDNSPNLTVIAAIKKLMEEDRDCLIFVNIRESYNIDNFKNLCKTLLGIECKAMLVINNNKPIIESNPADRDINNYNYDFYIYNNGTFEDLKDEADNFLRENCSVIKRSEYV